MAFLKSATWERLDELVGAVDGYLEQRSLRKSEAQRLRGRVAFGESLICGRKGALEMENSHNTDKRMPFRERGWRVAETRG